MRYLRKLKDAYHKLKSLGRCNHCKLIRCLQYIDPMTMYYREEENYVGFLCSDCKDAYIEYWTETWNDYNSSRM